MTTEPFRCSDASVDRGEDIFGTASFVRRWLLVEQPGAWGFDAVTQSRFPHDIAAELKAKTRKLGIRLILIRRGARLAHPKRQCYFVRTDEDSRYIAHMELKRPRDLLDLDLRPLLEGGSIEGATPHSNPVFLVCTHGRHDACCSIRGNTVSRVACDEPGFDTWECSHIGGDRFAANLVCFPHGLYYGRVDSTDVVDLMEGFRKGSVSLDHFRGRACHLFPVQAAEYFVRRERGLKKLDDLVYRGMEPTERGLAAAFALADGRFVEAEVAVIRTDTGILTCSATHPHAIPRYELLGITDV
ncbi:MAG TPA: sucrase ferredoxin [Actinomycetota bacterium]|nr:sucrase ferredoxin [Actinomycetota bacterium]